MLQPKLKVGRANDPLELEADRVAERVMSMPASEPPLAAPYQAGGKSADLGRGEHVQPVQAKLACAAGPASTAAPGIAQHVLRSSGQPLDPTTRSYFEPRFGADLGYVRIHTDLEAAQSAQALGASAYTAGSHIGFAHGLYQPATSKGRRLLAHELAHVQQQNIAKGAGAIGIQRQAAPNPAPVQTWARLWNDFLGETWFFKEDAATAIAKRFTSVPVDHQVAIEHGMEVVNWLESHNEPEEAEKLLDLVRAEFSSSRQRGEELPSLSNLPKSTGVPSSESDPARLSLALGKAAARAGRHDEAFKYLGVAHELLSDYAQQRTLQRSEGTLDRRAAYRHLKEVYDSLREIYGFYFVLQREKLAAGDVKGAQEAIVKGQELNGLLAKDFSPIDGPVEIIEGTKIGKAIRVEGINRVTTDLTALPGLTPPEQIHEGAQKKNLGDVQEALRKQSGLIADILEEPEIRKAFGTKTIDFNNTGERQKVWKVMYGVFQKQGPGALGSLMGLIGRYLDAFTVHTEFNIRDIGENYLTSEFPIDIAGRVQHDCGVYALSVAWDVFQTVKAGDPKMEVKFRLATSLDHVILLIDDTVTGETYLVNNNRITRLNQGVAANAPNRADPQLEAAKAYAGLRDLKFLVGPSSFTDLGTTLEPINNFKTGVWRAYGKATGGMATKQGALDRDLKRRNENANSVQKKLSTNAAILNNLVDQLKSHANDPQALFDAIKADMALASAIQGLFEHFEKAFRPFDQSHIFTVSTDPLHPLIRFALAIAHFQAVMQRTGFTTTDKKALDEQSAFLRYWRNSPIISKEMWAAAEAGGF